jgi:hypothetical protein
MPHNASSALKYHYIKEAYCHYYPLLGYFCSAFLDIIFEMFLDQSEVTPQNGR